MGCAKKIFALVAALLTAWPTLADEKKISMDVSSERVAITRSAGKIELWNIASNKIERILDDEGGTVQTIVRFSPNGSEILTSGKTIKIWNAATGALLKVLHRPAKAMNSALAYSPDGKLVAAGDGAGNVQIFDVASGKSVDRPQNRCWLTGPPARVTSLSFSLDGTLLAVGFETLTARCENFAVWLVGKHGWTGGIGESAGQNSPGAYVAFSRGGPCRLAVVDFEAIRIWNCSAGPRFELVKRLDGSSVFASFSWASEDFLECCDGKGLAVRNRDTGAVVRTFANISFDAGDAVTSTDGKWIAKQQGDEVHIFDGKTGQLSKTIGK